MKVRKWDGKPVSEPGWVSGIPIERYHSANMCAGPAVSSSDLRTMWGKSPKHMQARWAENPKREERKPTDAMLLGGCAHYLLLGEDNFKLKYVAEPETYRDTTTAEIKKWNNNALVCRDWHKKQKDAGRSVVKVDVLNRIVEMSKSLQAEALVQHGMLGGIIELSGFHRDQETGLWIKIRPDAVPTSSADFVDLKTSADVSDVALMSSIRSYGYHQQGALVWEVCEALGTPFGSFTLLFVETAIPYCARTIPLTDEDLARGRRQNRAMLRRTWECIQLDLWPGPGDGEVRALPLSTDERTRIDERLRRDEEARAKPVAW